MYAETGKNIIDERKQLVVSLGGRDSFKQHFFPVCTDNNFNPVGTTTQLFSRIEHAPRFPIVYSLRLAIVPIIPLHFTRVLLRRNKIMNYKLEQTYVNPSQSQTW